MIVDLIAILPLPGLVSQIEIPKVHLKYHSTVDDFTFILYKLL
jgi:hypothetical protein